jgi:spermidine synthase
LSILQGDAAEYLRNCTERCDVVMIDAFDRDGFAVAVSSCAFYLDVRDSLSANGAMVANMVGPKTERAAHLDMIADVFNGNIVVLPIKSDGNYLVFAFRDSHFEPRWRWIESQASAMQKRFGLDFPKFAASLKRSRKDGYLQATLHQNEEA